VNSKKWLALALALVMALALVGCGGGETEEAANGTDTGTEEELTGSITVQGSDTIVNLGQAWAESFQAENPGVTITVTGGGSGTGIASLINGTVDFANASREMKDEEKAQLPDAMEHEVAKDGIGVVVNPDNVVEELTLDQLKQIYTGEVTNWKDVGGADAEIVLLGRDTSSGTYEYFKEAVIGEEADYSASMKNLQSTQAIVDEVGKNANAIGYVGVGYINDTIKVLKIDGTAASVESVLAGDYVLSRGLYMYSNGEPEGVMAAYLDWILSPAGQTIVEEEGFVPVEQ
jgi:phosphate transport system substrate-binding protein